MADVNVALIGYAFMGKAHSNAYRQVAPFFSPRLTPRMKVLCGRTRREGQGRGAEARLGGDRDRLGRGRQPQGHRPRRHQHARRLARRDRDRRRARRQGGVLREAARQHRAGSRAHARRRHQGRRDAHDLPQLPPRARGHAGEAADRRRPARRDPPLSRHLPAGLDHRSEVPAGLAARQERRPAPARSATSPRTRSTSRASSSARSPRWPAT